MTYSPILADFIYEPPEDKPIIFEQVDISGVLLSILVEDNMVLAFTSDPDDHLEFFEEVGELPNVNTPAPGFDGPFDLATALNPDLSKNSPDEDILAAWHHWSDQARASMVPEQWQAQRWNERARTLQRWLAEPNADLHPPALEPLVTAMLQSPGTLAALHHILADPPLPIIEALKLSSALHQAAEKHEEDPRLS